MPRPRARLDPAAVTLAFAPDGLHGATTDAIARCAGVAKPTVYAHGGSKEAVFLGCVEAEVERLVSLLSDADLETRALSARARVRVLAEVMIEHGHAYPAAARLLYLTARHSTSSVAIDVDAVLARIPARLASILRHDTTPACADRVSLALLGASAAMALLGGDPLRDGALLGEAFVAVLEPLAEADAGVQTVGLY